jgi:hypothetical protein
MRADHFRQFANGVISSHRRGSPPFGFALPVASCSSSRSEFSLDLDDPTCFRKIGLQSGVLARSLTTSLSRASAGGIAWS